jgi:hypothetical protein
MHVAGEMTPAERGRLKLYGLPELFRAAPKVDHVPPEEAV